MGGWETHLAVGIYILMLSLTASHANEVNHCTAARTSTCSQCIQIGTGCAYCPDEIFEYERCDLKENLEAHKCRQMITVESTMEIKENVKINKLQKRSQVAPQLMYMSLLPGEEKEVEMEVFEPTRGPLDLYILMDFSNSMSDDLDNLKRMGDQLAELVGKISDDYTIGFGKFVDKVTEPQTDMRPSKLAQPWANSDPPFSFRNVITLTNNITYFRQRLQKERISGNLDAPEGGFDAILQAAVCQTQIGWRPDSTHLLVFSTESAFHYEADGTNVLAGILDRNDEKCHLTQDGNYTHDIRQDYPSIPTLVRLLMQHNIIPIFAITNHSYSYYEKLHDYFPIAELGQLQEDSSNILSILEKAFENIRSKISIRTEDKPKAVEAQILSQSGSSSEFGNFRITPGQIGKFKVRLKALTMVGEDHVCKSKPIDRAGMLRVKPTTFSSALRINAEVLCQSCLCEKTPNKNAVRCNGHGDFVCGKCQCYDGWLGPFCNCSAGASTDSAMCIGPDMKLPCNGKGDCMCGTCVCYNPKQFEGPFCQFDKSQCQRFGGFLCNDRGSCSMGRCVCTPGWTGDACECPTSNQTCLDSRGGICNGRGVCKCGRCECQHSGLPLSPTCESNFQAQLGMCEDKRSCVQCKAWNTGERKGRKCDDCHFIPIMVDELEDNASVIEKCSFRDEDDDCTYEYRVNYPLNNTAKEHRVLVKRKKDCPPAGFLWLIPLIMFLMLLLGLLLLCCWKYCACCQNACLALLPCCGRGRTVGFKEDHYLLRQSLLTSDHLDTPMVRNGPPKSTDIVRWKVTDNVHRGPNHPQNQVQPNPKETIQFPVSLRLNRQYSDTLSHPEARDADVLRQEVEDNLNNVFMQIPGVQRVQKTRFRTQRNSGKRQNNTIVDTVLSAPRASYPDIVKLTDKQVQAGNFHDLKVVPGYYTVASDREAAGAVEFQEGVESVDVRVPLFIKDEDDEKKELLVQAIDVPVGIAKINKDHVNITVIKEHARSIFTFLQPSYTFSRQDGVANIPISREIIEDGRTQVTYCTRDLTAKDKKDYISVDGDMNYGPGETQKSVPVKLLELGEGDGLLEDKQVKQFVMDLSNPRQSAKLGRYPRTTITIADKPEPSVVMFKKSTQTYNTMDPVYSIPVVRTRNQEGPTTVYWRTNKASRFDLSAPLKFGPGETEKNVVIDPRAYPSPIVPETLQLELFDPSTNAIIGERKTTLVNVVDARGDKSQDIQKPENVNKTATSPGGRLYSPNNIKAVPAGPRNIRLNWTPSGNANGYKVKYWIYGDPEADAQVMDVKTTHAELTNLYPYCDYEMRVCGYNGLGDGNYSDIIPCQTLEDIPGEPGRLAFNVISPTVTQVSWAEPAETNGVITAYEVIYTPINEDSKPTGATKKVMIDNPKKRMLLIENLQASQTYCYKVRARNKVGWGPYRDATINLATQPTRPMSIPIIPDIPIVDAEAGDDYDSYLMYSNEVLRSPTSSQRPSMTDLSDDQLLNGKWEQNFLFPGSSSSLSRNVSSSSTTYSHSTPRPAVTNHSSTTTYISGKGGSTSQRYNINMDGGLLKEEVTLRKRSDNRHYTDNDGVRDSIVMGNLSGGFLENQGVSSFSQSTTTSYSMSSRARTQSEDINDALLNLDRVLQETRFNPGVPETPSRLVFSALGPTALKVSWQEPHCETDVMGYCVLYQQINGGEIKRIEVNNPTQNSVVVQDLLPNQSYIFKVKAQSLEGWGPEREGVITIESAVDPKSPLSPMPGSPFTLSTPSAPGPLIFTALSPDTLQLSWERPRKPNGDILGYVVTCEQLHGGGDLRSFQVNGNVATSLTVSDLRENIPYKFKVQAQTTQGFGPEREGIITIESQDGGSMSQHSSHSVTKREVFNLPTEITSHTMFTEPFMSQDGMMMMSSRQITESGGTITRQVEMVQRGVMSSSTVTNKVERKYYEA
ncbi:integrin beta-4-like isoform X1 [Myxocyprinus asiaticus]|uniref:integrin beta-4-like isoform X1 n=1 Tax=Myxocyprinus asiaticus TaxID=70543 RepID=UPI0022234DB7|nr:integrin beta-4-like isoform X1 [Myxocyprinus asiaticus]XP_051508879.1 integrin beta-4-like isoform X1 [Myxocyprinus asiaticus]